MEPNEKTIMSSVRLLALAIMLIGISQVLELVSAGRLERRVDALGHRLSYDEDLFHWPRGAQGRTGAPDVVVVDAVVQEDAQPEPEDAVPADQPVVTPLRRSNARRAAPKTVSRETEPT